jgi:hypothetical protein
MAWATRWIRLIKAGPRHAAWLSVHRHGTTLCLKLAMVQSNAVCTYGYGTASDGKTCLACVDGQRCFCGNTEMWSDARSSCGEA